MNIQAVVSEMQSFSGLLPIAEKAEVKVSFWGAHYVYVAGYQEVLSINALAKRVLELLEQSKGEFEETEREPGKRLAKRIDWIYKDGHKQVSEANFFTIILILIRGIASTIFDLIRYGKSDELYVEHNWYGGAYNIPNDSFELYTDAQVQRALGMSPEEAERRNHVLQSRVDRDGKRFWLITNYDPRRNDLKDIQRQTYSN